MVYISTAAPLGRSGLDDLMATAVARNRERGITGFLLYNGRNFLQLIEGVEGDLRALFDRLVTDGRHFGMVTLENREIESRAFPEWDMRLLGLAESVAQRREALSAQLPEDLDPQIRRTVLNFASLN